MRANTIITTTITPRTSRSARKRVLALALAAFGGAAMLTVRRRTAMSPASTS
jgi:hypothetical protein